MAPDWRCDTGKFVKSDKFSSVTSSFKLAGNLLGTAVRPQDSQGRTFGLTVAVGGIARENDVGIEHKTPANRGKPLMDHPLYVRNIENIPQTSNIAETDFSEWISMSKVHLYCCRTRALFSSLFHLFFLQLHILS